MGPWREPGLAEHGYRSDAFMLSSSGLLFSKRVVSKKSNDADQGVHSEAAWSYITKTCLCSWNPDIKNLSVHHHL